MRTRLSSMTGLAVLMALQLAAPQSARADEKQVCLAASDKAQQLKLEGKLRGAREQLLVCARNECPGLVRQDCAQWMTEVIAALPSIVIGARDWQGRDLLDVTVSVDGAVITNKLDGKPFPVDPGVHLFHYESPSVPAPVDERVLVREGEKNRALTVTFAAPASPQPSPTAPGPDAASENTASAAPVSRGAPSALLYVFAGLGVAALGTALAFDLSANADVNAASQPGGCKPNCTSSQVDAVRTKWTIAGVALGVGVVSLGVATYYFFARPSTIKTDVKHASLGFDVVPTVGGGVAGVMGRF